MTSQTPPNEAPGTERIEASEHAVCMGFDALRICIGQRPLKFPLHDIIKWMETISDQVAKKGKRQCRKK